MGSKGDSYDNALAETINGFYKAELIHRVADRNIATDGKSIVDEASGASAVQSFRRVALGE